MTDNSKDRIRSQFGAAADDYAVSDIHARGESLGILVELIRPLSHWQGLDVAAGAGHTALAFAPHVANVTAVDLTAAMLAKTAQLTSKRGLANVETRIGDAEELPFDEASFDLVTCRLAFHHFSRPEKALGEFSRVLKPGGILGFTDNITVTDDKAASYYNAYEKLRDPSHHLVYPLIGLVAMLEKAGFVIEDTRELSKELEFQNWADRQGVSRAVKEELLGMMVRIPESLRPLLSPRWADGTMYFSLWEAVIVAHRK
jgi:ubiquinone/menaquinone biosynthesis C-methylase UbiE